MANKTGKNTPFKAGNKLWSLRENPGRDFVFKTPEELWEAAVGYFEWIEANPLVEEKGFAFQGLVTKEKFNKMRAMTIQGLCLHIGLSTAAFKRYRTDESHKDYHAVGQKIMDVIYDQKFTGAAAELLNPNIISRDLGLAEKSEVSENMTVVIQGDDAKL